MLIDTWQFYEYLCLFKKNIIVLRAQPTIINQINYK